MPARAPCWAAATCSRRKPASTCCARPASTGSPRPAGRLAILGFSARPAALAAGLPLPGRTSVFEQREVIGEHYRLAESSTAPNIVAAQMRKFGIKYSQLHPHAKAVRDAFVAVASPANGKACSSSGTPKIRRVSSGSGR